MRLACCCSTMQIGPFGSFECGVGVQWRRRRRRMLRDSCSRIDVLIQQRFALLLLLRFCRSCQARRESRCEAAPIQLETLLRSCCLVRSRCWRPQRTLICLRSNATLPTTLRSQRRSARNPALPLITIRLVRCLCQALQLFGRDRSSNIETTETEWPIWCFPWRSLPSCPF